MSRSSLSNATTINLGIVMKALENLPADIQTLFRYHFGKGLSHSVIAKETGLSLGTVKTRLRSGLLELLLSQIVRFARYVIF
jgi:RNA polymerase sigma-70 factor (ECF subfamily)